MGDCKKCPDNSSDNYDEYMLSLRKKIKTLLLIKALEDHVIKGTKMTSTQVNAGLALLKKSLPDISLNKIDNNKNADSDDYSHEEALKLLE